MKTLYRDAQEFPSNHSQQLVTTLEELNLAVEELHVAEEELLTQNEQLVAAQHTVESERQRYQDLFNFAPDGYLVTDLNGVVQEVNHAAAAILNQRQQYLIGKPLINRVSTAERIGFRTLLNHIVTTHRVKGWEFRVQRQDAEPVVVAATVQTVQDHQGNTQGLRWQLRDISDRKKAEAAINQLQAENLELLEADRLRVQLLATVSHELKTPLNAILGFSQVLMTQFSHQHDGSAQNMAGRILRNGQHLLGMVEDMLNFSRLRADHVELQLEPFDLIELVATTLDELDSLAQQKALTLTAELPEHPMTVVNDRSRLRQILTNLVSNAIRFTDAGRVVVSVETLPGDRLRIKVKDTGCGISPENQPHIFKEFWQVHSARNTHKGTGLGLAIVYALVQAMQGTISVASQPGRGSQFTLELPQTVTAGPPHPTPCRTGDGL